MNEREELTILRRIAELEAKAAGDMAPQGQQTRNNNLAAQIGLTARSGMNAAGGLVGLLADPIGGAINAATPESWPKAITAKTLTTRLADAVGLPVPDTPLQRIVSTGVEMGAGAAGVARGVGQIAAAAPTRGVAEAVATRLAAEPGTQAAAATAGGLAGQQAQESGAGPVGQFVSAVGGTVLGGGGVLGARAGVDAVKSMLPKSQAVMQRVDQTINISLRNSGIDPATITPAMRSMLREHVSKAMDYGQLDEKAVARLADYTRLGVTPTRGRLTLDPFDVTQEQNAAKVAAATGQRDGLLPTIQNDNNAKLLSLVDGFEPVRDSFTTGQRAMAPVAGKNASLESVKKGLYQQANEMAGGDIPLTRGPVLSAINDRLEASMKAPFLPAEIKSILNRLSTDPDAPFTVTSVDNLKTIIATAQRATQDGNVKTALAAVRDALDSVPMEPVKRQFGGNQVVTQEGAKFLRNQDAVADELKKVLDQARAANFEWKQWQRSAPGIEAAVNDANPTTFVQNFVRSRNADPRDVQRLAAVVNTDPGARQAVRAELVQYLKDASIGKGNESTTGNFSGRQWSRALSDVGYKKLRLFFEDGEIETLKALGRVGTTETFQPRGSAVNNSNTAAGMAGLLQGLSKMLKPVANKLPFGQVAISNPLDNAAMSLVQRKASNVPRALVIQQQDLANHLDPLLLPSLLGATSLQQRP